MNLPSQELSAAADKLMAQAAQALAEQRLEDVQKLCLQVLARNEQHEHAWFLRAAAAEGQGQPDLALDYLDKVRGAPDLLPRAHLARGRLLFFLDRQDEADAELAKAIRLAPDHELAYYLRGLTALRQGRGEDARRLLRQTVRLNPKFGPAHYELGLLALQAGDIAQALSACAAAAEYMPNSPEAMNNLALARQMAGDDEAAIAAYRKTIELRADYAEPWLNLGLLLQARDPDESARCIRHALDLKPELAGVPADPRQD